MFPDESQIFMCRSVSARRPNCANTWVLSPAYTPPAGLSFASDSCTASVFDSFGLLGSIP